MRIPARPINTTSLGLAIALVIAVGFGASQPAAAHVLKQDHGISAVLHIPPEDTPAANAAIGINLSFADTKNAFSLANCDCQAQVRLNEQPVQTVPIRPYFSGSALTGTATIRFPAIGVYELRIEGSAKDHSFPSFELEYPVRVATDANSSTVSTYNGKGASVILIAAGSLAILALFAYVAITHGPRYKKKLNTSKGAKRR